MSGGSARLATSVWVSALLRRHGQQGGLGAVLRRGEAESGAVALLLRTREGLVPLVAAQDGTGRTAWRRVRGSETLSDSDANAWLDRALRTDPDLWAVELEDPDGLVEPNLPPR